MDAPKTDFLVPCATPNGIVYLNPLHIVAVEPFNNTKTPTRIRLSTPLAGDAVGPSATAAIDSTEPIANIIGRVEKALGLFHQH